MPTYRDTKTGRTHQTVPGSTHDKRLAKAGGYRAETPAPAGPVEPARNGSRDDWAAYAVKVARDSDEVAAIPGLSRDELAELFAGRSAA